MAQIISKFYCGLLGSHVYSNRVNWKPFVCEEISIARELDNIYDQFIPAGRKIFTGTVAPTTIGHIPREISRHAWYTLLGGA